MRLVCVYVCLCGACRSGTIAWVTKRARRLSGGSINPTLKTAESDTLKRELSKLFSSQALTDAEHERLHKLLKDNSHRTLFANILKQVLANQRVCVCCAVMCCVDRW